MTTTADVKLTEGDGTKNVATYSITEDAEAKQLQRITQCDSAGSEIEAVTVGQDTMAASVPVVIASDQSAVLVTPYALAASLVSGAITTAMTGTTSVSLIGAPGGGLRNYITQITVSNSHATVGTDVIIQDGSGGTTLYTIPAAAVYGGSVVTFPAPLRQPTTATAIFCANVTTGASTKVSASGFTAA